jgi:hypothetical protein
MKLPFSHDAFLDVFGNDNTAFWPAVEVLWAVVGSSAVFVLGIRAGRCRVFRR